jgi:hypothetical protein
MIASEVVCGTALEPASFKMPISELTIPFLPSTISSMRDLDKTLVIQDGDKPLAVLFKYEHFMAMQKRI